MNRRSVQVKAILSMGILVGLGGVSTLAAWTGTATATSSITAAKVSLGVGATASSATSESYTVPVSSVSWYPKASAAAVVVVKNTGTVALPYSVKGSITESGGVELGKAMQVLVKTGSTVSGTAPNAICSGGNTVVDKSAGSAFGAAVDVSTLAVGTSESLCVQYSLPVNAANNLQGATTKLDLVFTGTVGS
ncbi:SipW-dependent-type signal peptide-containing protein [Glutamicibacter protophormiae]|uniref:SipW-dependent-type signal peptide-containing protein n=1 Tax=Glutamicibacter protophormiae TaxID=37930 RepID=UPI0033278241